MGLFMKIGTKGLGALLVSVGVVAALSGTAQGVQIQLTGGLHIAQTGNVGPLAIGQTQTLDFIDASSRFRGTVQVRNVVVGDIQNFEVRLTSFRYENYTASPTPETVTFEIIQDFQVSNAFTGTASGSHEFRGVANILAAGQLAVVDARSFHESVELPRLQYNPQQAYSTTGGGWRPITLNETSPQNVSVSGAYRIRNVYTFTTDTNPACDWMAIELAGGNASIGSYAELVLVPLPPAGWAGLASLGVVAVTGRVRRNRLRQA